ncbi:hypothetical protein ABTY61_28150 [Kitasatospora sp. NPDC096128]|uniref:hypothetical protein n=1 Tax=Kitasatospora sp. NPDC096128 TaxID=3155547 RepID=UPI003325280E
MAVLKVEHGGDRVHPLPLDRTRVERPQLDGLEDPRRVLLRVDPQPLDRRLNRGRLLLALGGLALGQLGCGGVRGALRAAGAQLGDPAGSPPLPRIAAATPAEVAGLATAADPPPRMLVALRGDLADAIRDTLARDCDAKALKAIAPHPGLTEARLLAVIDRHGPRVAAKAATNPDATAIVLERLTRQPACARKAFREIAQPGGGPRGYADRARTLGYAVADV